MIAALGEKITGNCSAGQVTWGLLPRRQAGTQLHIAAKPPYREDMLRQSNLVRTGQIQDPVAGEIVRPVRVCAAPRRAPPVGRFSLIVVTPPVCRQNHMGRQHQSAGPGGGNYCGIKRAKGEFF